MFQGKLVKNKLKGRARTALVSWQDQRGRCNNPRHKCYKWYGAKGVQVKYSSRDFIAWWLREAKGRRGRLVCDRIRSSGHYEFGNVQLITQSENASRQDRVNLRPVKNLLTGKSYPSLKAAAKAAGVSIAIVCCNCRGRRKVPVFAYER